MMRCCQYSGIRFTIKIERIQSICNKNEVSKLLRLKNQKVMTPLVLESKNGTLVRYFE